MSKKNIKNIKEELLCGNGDHFSLKDIMKTHFKDFHEERNINREFRDYVRTKLENGAVSMAKHSTSIRWLKIGVGLAYSLIAIVAGWLVYFVMNYKN